MSTVAFPMDQRRQKSCVVSSPRMKVADQVNMQNGKLPPNCRQVSSAESNKVRSNLRIHFGKLPLRAGSGSRFVARKLSDFAKQTDPMNIFERTVVTDSGEVGACSNANP